MQLNANKENICINQLIGQKNDLLEIQGDIIVNDVKPDVLNTICVNGNVCTYKREVLDGKVKLEGAINLYVIYLADDENSSIRSLNTSLDFTQNIDFEECRSGMNMDETLSIKNIECKVVNSRKINIRAFLDYNIKVFLNDNIEIINDVTDISDVQCLNDTIEVNSLLGNESTRVYAKDTLMVDNVDDIAEILNSDVNIVNKDIKISYNKILAKAEMQVRIMYLTEDNRINTTFGNVPIMGFVDMPNVSDTNICNTKYKLRNLIIRPNNVEEHSINVDAEVEIMCSAYDPKQINIIQDLYSPTCNLDFSQKQINTLVNKATIKDSYVAQDEFPVSEIGNNKLYDVTVNVNLQKQNIRNGAIDYEGEIVLELFFDANNSSRFSSKILKLPLNYTINNSAISENSSVTTNVGVAKQDFMVLADGNVKSSIQLDFEVDVLQNERISVIDNIDVGDKRDCNQYSMVIYFVKPKDTLWKIAKKFDSTVEEIARINDIEDVNRIMPGMQLYIPRYCKQI